MKFSSEKNQEALDNPKPGDYWHEMFCPYFLVVNVKNKDITVLSCIEESKNNARINVSDGWIFDYSKSITVNHEWIKDKVTYKTISGFVADVSNSEKTQHIVAEWRDYKQKELRQNIKLLEQEFEDFTGWKYLKKEENV